MKSVKKMSALALATLSLATVACQMPVEDEEGYIEQDAETLVAPGGGSSTCAAAFRAQGQVMFNERGMALRWFDECLQSSVDLQLVVGDNNPVFEGGTQTLYGELFSESGAAWGVVATLVEEDEEHHSVSIEVLDYGNGGGAISGDMLLGSDGIDFDGLSDWN